MINTDSFGVSQNFTLVYSVKLKCTVCISKSLIFLIRIENSLKIWSKKRK